ncbi:DUF1801 domain-containing protein [Corynebacterium glyciniphilum]|uniref:DUF1801 domain-containing protein n=1 Tax=Corynebacterium glyciniphilum TaxID=1404244 RepID=UPI00264EBD06|nr:DUF1801 domain-containing protein [Corynebacterium glyciniphilum]MDN5683799.1 DUF1801 domain-containing protein [Corynebacterium glyciniphilum]MDN6705025.1 DUF1801 domain-containing protein [Corynebacterium glyciniphilum]
MSKTHPHIVSPGPEQLATLVEERPEALPDVMNSVDTVDASIGYGAHQYGYNGWGMAAVTPYKKWVSLTLLHGADLEDPSALLTGTATMRHVKLASEEEFEANRAAIIALVRSAAELHEAPVTNNGE